MLNFFVSVLNYLKSFIGDDSEDVPLSDDERKEIYELTNANFKRTLQDKAYVLVFFHVPTCPDCAKFDATFQSIKKHINDKGWSMHFGRIDISAEKELANRYNVKYVPAIGLFMMGNAKLYQEEVNSEAQDPILKWVIKTCLNCSY